MSEVYRKLEICLESVRAKTDFKPEVALILGSGLGDYADEIQIEQTISYTEIEGFPTSTVAGHKGRFVFGYVNEVPVVIMQGRVHYYEGYPMSDVVLPTRLMGMMGAKKLMGPNIDELGVRFSDMSEVYSTRMRGDGGMPYGSGSMWNFLHHESGGRNVGRTAGS